jgi:hypothetical protein
MLCKPAFGISWISEWESHYNIDNYLEHNKVKTEKADYYNEKERESFKKQRPRPEGHYVYFTGGSEVHYG